MLRRALCWLVVAGGRGGEGASRRRACVCVHVGRADVAAGRDVSGRTVVVRGRKGGSVIRYWEYWEGEGRRRGRGRGTGDGGWGWGVPRLEGGDIHQSAGPLMRRLCTLAGARMLFRGRRSARRLPRLRQTLLPCLASKSHPERSTMASSRGVAPASWPFTPPPHHRGHHGCHHSSRRPLGCSSLALLTPPTAPMTERSAKPASSRKRALVSCDRCKIRRARCIRDNADVPCADCKASGVPCESKLPRKQRVYGSVETLSLRYRALDALVKGLFPTENVHDTETLFRIAAARNIPMPASDDFTPADIFSGGGGGSGSVSGSDQRASSSSQKQQQQQQQLQLQPQAQQKPQQYPQRQVLQPPFHPSGYAQQALPSPHTTVNEATHSSGSDSPPNRSKQHRRNTFSESQQPPSQSEDLLRPNRRTSHYFGPSSSFRLAKTIRTLAARWIALTGASAHSFISDPSSASGSMLKRSSTDPSNEDLTMHESSQILHRSRKRSRSQLEDSGDESQSREQSVDGDTTAKFLPPRNVADALVTAYFDRVHMYMPLFKKSVFDMRLEATYTRRTELVAECKDSGWLVVLALIFSFGCEQLEPECKQLRELRVKYLEFSRTHFRQLLSTACLDNVQALVLLNLHHHSVGQKSSSWLLIGLAARMVRHSTCAKVRLLTALCRQLPWECIEMIQTKNSSLSSGIRAARCGGPSTYLRRRYAAFSDDQLQSTIVRWPCKFPSLRHLGSRVYPQAP